MSWWGGEVETPYYSIEQINNFTKYCHWFYDIERWIDWILYSEQPKSQGDMLEIFKILFVGKEFLVVIWNMASWRWWWSVELPKFNCIAHFKRKIFRAAGVAIYQNSNISRVSTTNTDLMVQNATEINVSRTAVCDMCAS